MPDPSFNSQVIVAARGLAFSSPTPRPSRVAFKLRAPAIELQ